MNSCFPLRSLVLALAFVCGLHSFAQNWTQVTQFLPPYSTTSPEGGQGDEFGKVVDISGAFAVVGSPSSDFNGPESGLVFVYEKVAGTWALVTQLASSDGVTGDLFGSSVAIDSDRIVVGSPGSDPVSSTSGAVYVFELIAGTWTETAKVFPAVGATSDLFGSDVDVAGDRLLVSALGQSDNGAGAGAAYIFELETGTWVEKAKLIASDGAAQDNFGFSVALDDTVAVCGAYTHDVTFTNQGAAFVFSRNGGAWPQSQKLIGTGVHIHDQFGIAVAADNGRIIVGSRLEDDGTTDSGSAYIFEHTGASYTLSQKIHALDDAVSDQFGRSVDIDGDVVVVGAFLDDDNGSNSGSMYIFNYSTSWNQTAKIKPADGAADDRFGQDVAISGTNAISGAWRDDDSGIDSGSAYFFGNPAGTWVQEFKASDHDMIDDPSGNDFGSSVAISWDNAIVGSSGDDDDGSLSGSATFFAFDGSQWSETGKVYPSDPGQSKNFGRSVSINGNMAAVGAIGDATKGQFAGAVYIFEKSGSVWTQTQKVVALDGASFDNFGWTVEIEDDVMVVGSYLDDDKGNNSGSVYIYRNIGGQWFIWQKITATDGTANDHFGFDCDINGDRLVVSARDDAAQISFGGSAYVFEQQGNGWSQIAKLVPSDPSSNKLFGQSISYNGESVLVGAIGDNVGAESSGAAYVFNETAGVWSQSDKLKLSNVHSSQFFGYSVDHTMNRALIGAYRAANSSAVLSGVAGVFEPSGASWSQTATLEHSSGGNLDYFGIAVALEGSTALIGAQYDDDNGENAGSAFVFNDCLDADMNGICDFEEITCINNSCDSAYAILPSTFGISTWDTLSFLGASESLAGCAGNADDDIWYSFVAGHANDLVMAHDPNGVSDVVVEVFEGCGQPSIGCYNNYGAGEIERAIPGGLIPGHKYVYRVYDAAVGPSTSTDIRTQVKTFASGAIRAKYCGRVDYSLDDYITPERQDLYELYPYTQTLVSAYNLQFTDQSNSMSYDRSQFGYASQFFHLSDVQGLEFNHTYDGRAKHGVYLNANGAVDLYWSDYGSSCVIGTAGPVATSVKPAFCNNAVGYTMSDYVQAYYVPYADIYRFFLDDGSQVITKNFPSYTMFLNQVPGLEFGTTYSVTVQARVNDIWGEIGNSCDITMQGTPPNVGLQSQYCDVTYPYPSSQYLLADQVIGAQKYEWRFVPDAGGTTLYKQTNGLSIAFHTSGLPFLNGASYDVAVRVKVAGQWGIFSSECTISLAGTTIMPPLVDGLSSKSIQRDEPAGLMISPNPNPGDGFTIQLPEEIAGATGMVLVEIYTASGQQIDTRPINLKGQKNLSVALARRLSAGLYLVKMTRGSQVFVSRMSVE